MASFSGYLVIATNNSPNAGSKPVVVGDAKLELEFNDLNPRAPVLLVKLHDILFSSKTPSSGEWPAVKGDFLKSTEKQVNSLRKLHGHLQ